MLKKISYLASVSIIASVTMGAPSYAVYEEELGEVISHFQTQQKAIKSTEKKEAPKEEENSWWGYVSSAGSALTPVVRGTGNVLRWAGDQVRGETVVGDILTQKAKGAVSYYGGDSASEIVEKVGEKESNASYATQTAGNALRWLGACLTEETPTLARALRQFWIDKRDAEDAEQALTSTACALYLYRDQIGGVDAVKNNYRKFLKAWNSGSYTGHSEDAEKNKEYFLKGLIRGFAKDNLKIKSYEDISAHMLAFEIDYEILPFVKKITPESICEKEEKIENITIGRLQEARQSAFVKFVQNTFALERMKLSIDQDNPSLRLPEPTSTSMLLPATNDNAEVLEDNQDGNEKEKEKEKENK